MGESERRTKASRLGNENYNIYLLLLAQDSE